MKLVALDQNAISNLAFPPSAIWADIFELLKRGVKEGSLLCPTPPETISESVHLDKARREAVEFACAELSGGYFFRFPWEIIALEALAKVRPGINTFPLWIPATLNKTTESDKAASVKAILKDKEQYENATNFTLSREEKDNIRNWASNDAPINRLG